MLFLHDSVVAGRGIVSSAIATGVLGFATTILFLFCTPDLDTLFALDAPQPFVQIYAMALGKGPSIFMTVIAIIGLIMVRGSLYPSALFWLISNPYYRTQVSPWSLPHVLFSLWLATAFSLFRDGSVG